MAKRTDASQDSKVCHSRAAFGLALVFCLFGCGAKKQETYSYCAVTSVDQKQEVGHLIWIAHCSDGNVVIFPRVVKEGDGVYFTPYWEGDDAVQMRGYIKRIEDLL